MNWFDILKEQRQVARNIQSFKPIQFDKPIKLNKPKDTTCRDKLIDLYKKALNSFSDGKRKDTDLSNEDYDFGMVHEFIYKGGKVFVKLKIPNEGILPDDIYCRLLNVFEKVEKTGPNSSDRLSYEYIDYNLKEPKLVIGDSEIWYSEVEKLGTSDLGFYTYINDSSDLHKGHDVVFAISTNFKDRTIEEGFDTYGSPILRHKMLKDFKNWRGLF